MDEADKLIKKIGENIVRIRKEQNLTQVELAARLNIEDSALRRIEKGRTNPTIKSIYAISKELDINLIELFN
ncbi:helix-turn-helix domain-containing protein [Owenweeksia hongkongensis]|uniref:helix-turn-helix domain-containing protein n=1 Tax=Owenweeksia hongkongensis TaxID=253245 RepID=UPI003A8F6B37